MKAIMELIRVLHVVTIMNRNGLENRIMDIYRNIDRNRIQFDFLVHRKEVGHFDDEINKLGGRIYRIMPLKPTKFFSYMKCLISFFYEHREYYIVHSHVNTFSSWVLWAAKKAGIKIRIAHSRTWGMEHSWKAIFKYISKIFINISTTHKFACSKQAGEWLFGKKGIKPPNFFKVIPNSIDIRKFTFNEQIRNNLRNELNLNKEQLAFVHVGRFVPQKNHQYLLQIFNEIRKINKESKLFLIGEGELESTIRSTCKELGLEKYVVYLGVKDNVGDYLNAMDAFLFPSLFEGFGTVTIEAQCSGLPVLASESIPHETKIINSMEFLPISISPSFWAAKILEMIQNHVRIDFSLEVKKAGYDIKDTYIDMQNFYSNV
jgi:Glycosyltransferase